MEIDQIEKLKLRIQKENLHNSSKRRRFSTRLKNDIIKLAEEQDLSSYSCSKLLGIGNTTLDKWKSHNKNKFKKIKIISPQKRGPYKQRLTQNVKTLRSLKINQLVLLSLVSLLIFERIFRHVTG
jgi:transposase-like protein